MLNSSSRATSESKINIEDKIVLKINKKEYVIIKLHVFEYNEKQIQKLMKDCNAIIQSMEEIDTQEYYIRYLIPSNKLSKLSNVPLEWWIL